MENNSGLLFSGKRCINIWTYWLPYLKYVGITGVARGLWRHVGHVPSMTHGVDGHWIGLDDARQNCCVYNLVCLPSKHTHKQTALSARELAVSSRHGLTVKTTGLYGWCTALLKSGFTTTFDPEWPADLQCDLLSRTHNAINIINQSIKLFAKSRLPVRQQSIELDAHDHKHVSLTSNTPLIQLR